MTSPANPARAAYLRVLVLVSVALVLATLIFRVRSEYVLWLAPFSLGEENVIAAWFSGTLLLLASLHAADGFFRLRQTHPKAAFAWCVIAGMLLFLSADEIACLHERIEHLRTGPILSFVPFIVAMLAGCAWSFRQLWITPSERSRVKGLLLGVALLMSIGVQEIAERLIELPWYLRPIRTAIEEGTELAGMLILIRASLANSEEGRAFLCVAALRWPLAVLGVALAWPLAVLTASLGDQATLGHFSDWFSAVLFTASAALIVRSWLQSTVRESFPVSAVALICAAAAICVQFDPVGNHETFPASSTVCVLGVVFFLWLLLLTLSCLGTAEALRARGRDCKAASLMMACVGLLAAVFAMYSTPDAVWWGYFATTAVATGTFAALAAGLRNVRTDTLAAYAPRMAP